MRGSLSVVGLVGVAGARVHEPVLGGLVQDKPDEGEEQNAFPHRVTHLVPHLSVKVVNLLHASHVVLAGAVGEGPNAQVVHVSHVSPRVLEFNVFGFGACVLINELRLAC